MLKYFVMVLSILTLFGVFTLAQDQPTNDKKEKQECSKGCCSGHETHSEMQMNESKETTELEIWNKVCPVKGEEVDAEAPTFEYDGKVIGFCCSGCDTKFQKDPEQYMKNLNKDGSEFIGS